MKSPNFLVIAGDGVNCERETAHAIKLAGGEAQIIHVNDFLTINNFDTYQAIVFPGGFSFGDQLGSGLVLARKIELKMKEALKEYLEKDRLILGICNGFQILSHLKLFDTDECQVRLVKNAQNCFIDKWAKTNIAPGASLSPWFNGLEEKETYLPIRHGEGRVFSDNPDFLKQSNQIILRYQEDVNGSLDQAAGVCSTNGKVTGLMPHPEAALASLLWREHLLPNHRENYRQVVEQFWKNGVSYFI